VAGLFAITALAIAAERANAVGAVRLTCLPEGLEIELLRAAGFTEGFAPSSVAESVSFTVPYTAVRGLVRRGRSLCLALDPAVVTPHNRFALVRFTSDPAEALAGTYRARLAARWLSYLVPIPAGLLAVLLAPSDLVGGALGLASLALVVALGVGLVISLVQAVTQIQEQTLSFVPKLVAVAATFLVALPWTLQLLVKYTTELFRSLPSFVG